jgi:hypothetical protein
MARNIIAQACSLNRMPSGHHSRKGSNSGDDRATEKHIVSVTMVLDVFIQMKTRSFIHFAALSFSAPALGII